MGEGISKKAAAKRAKRERERALSHRSVSLVPLEIFRYPIAFQIRTLSAREE